MYKQWPNFFRSTGPVHKLVAQQPNPFIASLPHGSHLSGVSSISRKNLCSSPQPRPPRPLLPTQGSAAAPHTGAPPAGGASAGGAGRGPGGQRAEGPPRAAQAPAGAPACGPGGRAPEHHCHWLHRKCFNLFVLFSVNACTAPAGLHATPRAQGPSRRQPLARCPAHRRLATRQHLRALPVLCLDP